MLDTLMLFNGFNKGDREYTLDHSYPICLFISTFLPNLKKGSALNSLCASPICRNRNRVLVLL